MIKKFCDRCGKEIVGEPWYMRWYQNTMSGLGMGDAMVYSSLCSRADSVDSYSTAVSQSGVPMYCDECRMAILAFAAEKPEQVKVEPETSDEDAFKAARVIAKYCCGRDCDKCIFEIKEECALLNGRFTPGELMTVASYNLERKGRKK